MNEKKLMKLRVKFLLNTQLFVEIMKLLCINKKTEMIKKKKKNKKY